MIYPQGKSSGVITSSAAINSAPGRVLGVMILAGADAASVQIKDGGSSGTAVTVAISVGAGNFDYVSFNNGIQCSTSIYATITGTTPDVVVIYED